MSSESPNKRGGRGRQLYQLVSVGCIVAILVLSWLPGESRPSTGLSNLIEHFCAYAITAWTTMLAFVPPRTIRAVLMGMILLAATAELGQNFVPGREPRVIDFLAGATAAAAAICALALLRRRP
jgi:VanZ family protein